VLGALLIDRRPSGSLTFAALLCVCVDLAVRAFSGARDRFAFHAAGGLPAPMPHSMDWLYREAVLAGTPMALDTVFALTSRGGCSWLSF
jgi:hypothetical protein